MKTKFLLFLFLLFSSVTNLYADNLQLNAIKLKDLSSLQKKYLLQDLHIFVKTYEQSKKSNHKKYSSFSAEEFLSYFLKSAHAGWGDSCLFGGWPSTTDGNNLCFKPQKKNPNYSRYEGKCSSNELYCNPTLFGHDLCVPFNSRSDMKSAYQNCNNKFEDLVEKGERNFEQVAYEADEKEFLSLMDSIQSVCNYGEQTVTGMCANLKNKVSQYITDDTSVFVKNLISAKNSDDEEFIATSLSNSLSRIEELSNFINTECDDNNLPESKLLECQKAASEFNALEKHSNELVLKLESEDPALYQSLMCSGLSSDANIDDLTGAALDAASEVGCTEAEKKTKKENCAKDIKCSAMSTFMTINPFLKALTKENECLNSGNDCITNLVTGIAKNITDLFGGIWGLLKLGYNAAADKIGSLWDKITGAEDNSTEKQLAAAGLGEDDINEIEKNPKKWYQNLWDGIKSEIDRSLKEHVGCQQWSGVPHYSTCTKPFKGWDCMSCKTYITGFCSVAGYLAPEIATLIFSGGLGNLAKSVGTGAKILTSSMRTSGKLGKVFKAVGNNAVIKALTTGGKFLAKGGKVLAKGVSSIFGAAVKGIKALSNLPGIKQTKNIIKKIGSSVGNTKAARALKKVKKKGDDALTRTGKKIEDRARRTVGDGSPAGGGGAGAGTRNAGRAARVGDEVVVFESSTVGNTATLQQKVFSKAEVDNYFDNVVRNNPAQRQVYDDFVTDLKTKYPNITDAELDDINNMLFNIHKHCNPVPPSKDITGCKKRMLATMRDHLKSKYPEVDATAINKMADEKVKILGEQSGLPDMYFDDPPAGTNPRNYDNFRDGFNKNRFDETNRYVSAEIDGQRVPLYVVGREADGMGLIVKNELGETFVVGFDKINTMRTSSTSKSAFQGVPPSTMPDPTVDSVVLIKRTNGTYSNGKVIGVNPDGTYKVAFESNGQMYYKNNVPKEDLGRQPANRKRGPPPKAGVDAESILAKLNPEQARLLREKGLIPHELYTYADGTQAYLSKKFMMSEREAYVSYIVKDGQVYPRIIYKSNSQGVFRISDGISGKWFSKGVGEEFMSIPPDLQKKLLMDTSSASNVSLTDIVNIDSMNKDYMELARKSYEKKVDPNVFKSRDALRDARHGEIKWDATVNGRRNSYSLKDPRDVAIKDQALRPNFNNPVDTYKTKTSTSRDVDVMVYKSHDGSVTYKVFKDQDNRIWFGDIHTNGEVNKFGIVKNQNDFSDLLTPRWEYSSQVAPQFKGRIPPKDGYETNWNYLKEVPEVQEWYRANNIPIPGAE